MFIYLIGFTLSILLFYISNKIKNNSIIKKIVIIIALLIPCFIAGLRSDTIGTDVEVYVKKLHRCALSAGNIKQFFNSGWNLSWRFKHVSEYEYGFLFLVYFTTKFFGSLQCVLFVIQLFTIIPVYLGLKKFKQFEDKIWLGMLVYYFTFFCLSLNLMRQMIGIAIVFYAFSILLNEKKSNFIVILLILFAMLFHKSSALGFILYFIYIVVNHQEKNNLLLVVGQHKISLLKCLLLLFLAFAIIVVFNSKFLNTIVNLLGFDSYSGYITGESKFNFKQLLLRLPILLLFVAQFKQLNKYNKNFLTLYIIFIFDLLLSNLSSASMYAIRISFLFEFFNVISLVLLANVSENRSTNNLNRIIVITYSIVYWYYMYVISGVGHVIPYKFFC